MWLQKRNISWLYYKLSCFCKFLQFIKIIILQYKFRKKNNILKGEFYDIDSQNSPLKTSNLTALFDI